VRQMYAGAVERETHGLHQGLIQSGIALAIMTAVSIALGWLVAGRVLRPLRTMTATTRQISERNLNERLALSGPRDELRDLADTVDGLLARLEAHVGQQQRFAAPTSGPSPENTSTRPSWPKKPPKRSSPSQKRAASPSRSPAT
jgi:methyl-accepting chemotaxis protein